jgi:hypothetical protein
VAKLGSLGHPQNRVCGQLPLWFCIHENERRNQSSHASRQFKKKSVTPVVGGWVKKGPGSGFVCGVFELPSPRNAQKRGKKLTSKFLFFVDLFGKSFDMDFLQKYVYGGFELPLPRNARKRTSKKHH